MAHAVADILFAPYELSSPHRLNSREARGRAGFLLQVHFADGLTGYCDFHFFKSHADPLLALKKQIENPQQLSGERLDWARWDAEARSKNEPLIPADVRLPTHKLIQDLSTVGGADLERLWEKGFRLLKIKLGADSRLEQGLLLRLKENLSRTPFRLRLDFNASNTKDSWEDWHHWLLLQLEDSIDFVEDPLPWDEAIWSQSEIPLALDFEAENAKSDHLEFLKYVVVKPALVSHNEPGDFSPRRLEEKLSTSSVASERLREKLLVTHLMDHPLGQSVAARWAWNHKIKSTGGFLNGDLTDSLGFHEDVQHNTSEWRAPHGAGWGFGGRLGRTQWRIFT